MKALLVTVLDTVKSNQTVNCYKCPTGIVTTVDNHTAIIRLLRQHAVTSRFTLLLYMKKSKSTRHILCPTQNSTNACGSGC